MSTLEAILKGGGASRESRLYQWLATRLGKEEVESFADSCQLRGGIISAFFGVLASVFVYIFVLGLVLVVGWDIVKFLMQEGLGDFLATCGPPILAVVALGGALYAVVRVGERSRPLGRVLGILLFLGIIAAIVLPSATFFQEIGVSVGADLSLSRPEVFVAEVYENLEQYPVGAAALGWAATILFIAVVVMLAAVIGLLGLAIWRVITFFRTMVGRTNFWAWLRGRLCHEFAWID